MVWCCSSPAVVPGEPGSPHLAPAPPPSEEGKRQRTPSIDRGLDDYEAHTDAMVRLHLQLGSPAAALMHAAATPAAAPRSAGPGQAGSAQARPGAAPGQAAGGQREAQPGPWQHVQQAGQQHHGGGRSRGGTPSPEEELLFSPVFHLCREDLAGHAAGAEQGDGTTGGLPPLPPVRLTAREPPAAQQVQQQQQQAARGDTENTASTDHSTGTSACLDADASDASDDGEAALPAALASPPGPCPPVAPADEAGEAAEGCEGEYMEFDPLLFIKRLPPLERCVPPRRDFLLPKKTRRSKQKTLVLDLDETLVHSTLDGYCRPGATIPPSPPCPGLSRPSPVCPTYMGDAGHTPTAEHATLPVWLSSQAAGS